MSTQSFDPRPSTDLVQIGDSTEAYIQQRLAEERARLEREAGVSQAGGPSLQAARWSGPSPRTSAARRRCFSAD